MFSASLPTRVATSISTPEAAGALAAGVAPAAGAVVGAAAGAVVAPAAGAVVGAAAGAVVGAGAAAAAWSARRPASRPGPGRCTPARRDRAGRRQQAQHAAAAQPSPLTRPTMGRFPPSHAPTNTHARHPTDALSGRATGLSQAAGAVSKRLVPARPRRCRCHQRCAHYLISCYEARTIADVRHFRRQAIVRMIGIGASGHGGAAMDDPCTTARGRQGSRARIVIRWRSSLVFTIRSERRKIGPIRLLCCA